MLVQTTKWDGDSEALKESRVSIWVNYTSHFQSCRRISDRLGNGITLSGYMWKIM